MTVAYTLAFYYTATIKGPGKSAYALPVMFCFLLSYIRVLPVGGVQKVGDVRRKTYTLIYPDPYNTGPRSIFPAVESNIELERQPFTRVCSTGPR
jgi:hypothetical protein